MQFRTEISVRPSANKIDLKDGIVTIGSCFADEIAQKFMDFKFQVCKNPFGTVYNPISIHKLLKTSLLNGSPSPDGFLERDSISYHYDFHSDWNGKSRD